MINMALLMKIPEVSKEDLLSTMQMIFSVNSSLILAGIMMKMISFQVFSAKKRKMGLEAIKIIIHLDLAI